MARAGEHPAIVQSAAAENVAVLGASMLAIDHILSRYLASPPRAASNAVPFDGTRVQEKWRSDLAHPSLVSIAAGGWSGQTTGSGKGAYKTAVRSSYFLLALSHIGEEPFGRWRVRERVTVVVAVG